MLKAVFIDYTGTMIEEGGPDAMQMLRRCYKNSDIDSMESMLAYWWKLIKYFEAASSGDSFLTQDEIVDRTLEVCEKEIHLKENFEEIHELCGSGCMHRLFLIRRNFLRNAVCRFTS